MAGPEGFDASMIETEALLKKMKPRPANLSAARIVYEAGRAVGREEMQAQLASSGLMLAGAPLAAPNWKKWVMRSWAGGATVVALVLFSAFLMNPTQPETPEAVVHIPSPHSQPLPHYTSPGFQGFRSPQTAENKQVAPASAEGERQIVAAPSSSQEIGAGASDSNNQSGTPRVGPDIGKPKEQNLAQYIRDRLPTIETKRGIDAAEIQDGILKPAKSGMALTTLGFIKSP